MKSSVMNAPDRRFQSNSPDPTCGCCAGLETLTPLATANRPGLKVLNYRIGTYASFLESMLARLSANNFAHNETGGADADQAKADHSHIEGTAPAAASIVSDPPAEKVTNPGPLSRLTTRQPDDLAIALLDSWATVGDVLTFYQERFANEGYLRTAIERRSILELARLVGYRLRPGVAASVFLAYELDKGEKSLIPKGARAQSVPGPGELPQSFETSEDLLGWSEWNNLKPRQTRPLNIAMDNVATLKALYIKGLVPDLQPNSPLVLVFHENAGGQIIKFVEKAEAQFAEQRTKVILQAGDPPDPPDADFSLDSITALEKPPVQIPVARQHLRQELVASLAAKSQAGLSLMAAGSPRLKQTLTPAMAHAAVSEKIDLKGLHVMRLAARPFGANAPLMAITDEHGVKIGESEWPLDGFLKILMTYDSIKMELLDTHFLLSTNNQTEMKVLTVDNIANSETVEFSLRDLYVRTGWVAATKTLVLEINSSIMNIENLELKLPQSAHDLIFEVNGVQKTVTAGNRLQYRTDTYYVEIARSASPVLMTAGITAPPSIMNYIDYILPLPVEDKTLLTLDTINEKIIPDSWVVINRPSDPENPMIAKVSQVSTIGNSQYGFSATVTQLKLKDEKGEPKDWLYNTDLWLSTVRQATVYALPEQLELSEEPIDPLDYPVGCRYDEKGGCVNNDWIELDGWYPEVEPGRWLIVTGERTDIPGTSGVQGTEAVLLAEVQQGVSQAGEPPDKPPFVELPPNKKTDTPVSQKRKGDQQHTFLRLEKPLEYCYKRDTVTIYGNVVKATHGETRNEVLGSGDASKLFTQYALKVTPVTFLAAPTARGAGSTLQVRVNDVLWHEADNLFSLDRNARVYITKTDNEGKTFVIFGDGMQGLRPPTGVQNLTALYRNGIGKGGNVAAGKITLLSTRPLHVKGVNNPLPAAGGADPDTRDQARRNAPLAVMALDRLVSVQDYADFARTFAGIGKASAVKLSDGRRQVVHLTIAGLDDIPIDENSDLYINLRKALLRYGEERQALIVKQRELNRLVLQAKIYLKPDYLWEKVKPRLEAAVLDAFSFDHRELGQDAMLSEVLRVLQVVEGVNFVDIDSFGAIPEKHPDGSLLLPAEISEAISGEGGLLEKNPYTSPRITADLARIDDNGILRPAQIAYFTPDVPATLVLNLGNNGGRV